MAYNITIEFMDATYDIRGSQKTAFNLGDIVEVYDHRVKPIGTLVSGVNFELFNTPPTTPRKWFMHVLAVPDLDFQKFKDVLLQEYLDYDVVIITEPKGSMERFRKWGINLSVPNINKITVDKQITFTYAKFQNAILDKTGSSNLFTDVTFG